MSELGGADKGGDEEIVLCHVGVGAGHEDVATCGLPTPGIQQLSGGRKLEVGCGVIVLFGLHLPQRQ